MCTTVGIGTSECYKTARIAVGIEFIIAIIIGLVTETRAAVHNIANKSRRTVRIPEKLV